MPFLFPGSPSFAAGGWRLPAKTLGLQFAPPGACPGPAALPAAFPSAAPAGTAELTPENSKHALALRITGRPPPLPHAPEGADPRVRPLHTALSPGGERGLRAVAAVAAAEEPGEDALAKKRLLR